MESPEMYPISKLHHHTQVKHSSQWLGVNSAKILGNRRWTAY